MIILAETAAQGTSAEKYCTAACLTADTGLLPVVQSSAGGKDAGTGFAVTGLNLTVYSASARTKSAGGYLFFYEKRS